MPLVYVVYRSLSYTVHRYGTIDRLLQGFMGNTYRTAFITHVAPKTDCGVESLNALRLIFEASQLQVHVPVAPYHPGKAQR